LKAGRVFALSLAAGVAAGVVLVAMNFFVIGPYVQQMSDAYVEAQLSEGDFVEEEFDAKTQALNVWQAAFPMVIGAAGGALVAGAYIKAGKDPFKIALVVAGTAWFSLYVMPALKYPYNPDTLFNPDAAGQYMVLFAAYAASSGAAALGSFIAFAKTGRNNWYVGAAGVYLAIAAVLFFVFPDYQQPYIVRMSLLGAWRSASAAGMTAFWFTLGILAGVLLEREEKKGVGRGI
jgi:hypothetical protein